MSKFRGQVNVDDQEVVEGGEESNENSRTRRIQSVSGGSPLMKTSGRRKSQNTSKTVTIKTSTSSVPTPGFSRKGGVASSASNDIILHVGGQAWTRESLAYGTSRDNSRPNSAHGSNSNIQHRKSVDQSSLISSSSIINHQIPSLRPTSSDSLTHQPPSGVPVTKVAGDYVQSKAENSFSSFSEQPQDYHSIKFVDEQSSHDVNLELVQKAFKEYKDDINQSLSDLDTKIDRLESMIALLVERMPQTVVPHNTITKGKNNNSKSADEDNINQHSNAKMDS